MAANHRKVQSFCQELLASKKYRADLRVRLEERTIHPSVEAMIWHYAYGKPVNNVDLTVHDDTDLTTLSNEELALRSERIALALRTLEPDSSDESMAGTES